MQETLAPRRGGVLIKSPNARHQAARRRWFAAGALLALALSSWTLGAISHPRADAVGKPRTGPFSYIPSQ
jgi:hypothetical protein